MNRIFTLLTSMLLLIGYFTEAQVVEVSVGPSYSQQAYFNIETGKTTVVNNDAWDIAFSNDGFADAGIFINESTSFMGTPLKLFVSQETNWENPITDLSSFIDENRIFNEEENWTEGAFNSVKDPDSNADYGWGVYNPSSHIIEGSKIYVLQLRDESYIKIEIQSLSNGEYTFRYADLDGENEKTVVVSKSDAGDVPLIHFSFSTDDLVEMPTDYDLIFQRYVAPIEDGSGDVVQYPVTGVLLAPNTSAVIAKGVNTEEVLEEDFADQYSTSVATIGYDWKYFDFSSGWVIDDTRAQFVKTAAGKTFKIVFFDFEGSSTGITTLEKTEVNGTSSLDKNENIQYSVFPNPTKDFIIVQAPVQQTTLTIYDESGRLILVESINSEKETIDVSQLHSGAYHLIFSQNDSVISTKTLVKN